MAGATKSYRVTLRWDGAVVKELVEYSPKEADKPEEAARKLFEEDADTVYVSPPYWLRFVAELSALRAKKEKPLTLNEYQELAMATRNPSLDLTYAAGKLACEAGELLQLVLKETYHGKLLDPAQAREEAGDALWYVALIAKELHITLEELALENLRKLSERHGAAYNPEHYKTA